MPFDIDIDPMVSAALEQVAQDVHGEIIDLIESWEWEWRYNPDGSPIDPDNPPEPVETRRKNKDVVTSPRDIVDLGRLRDSQDYRVDGNQIVFYNTADHSRLVHEGGSNGHAILPGRPFMTTAMANLDVVARVAQYLGYEIEEWATGTIFRDPTTKRFTGRGLRGADTGTETTDFDY